MQGAPKGTGLRKLGYRHFLVRLDPCDQIRAEEFGEARKLVEVLTVDGHVGLHAEFLLNEVLR